jgi:hypothetical protein
LGCNASPVRCITGVACRGLTGPARGGWVRSSPPCGAEPGGRFRGLTGAAPWRLFRRSPPCGAEPEGRLRDFGPQAIPTVCQSRSIAVPTPGRRADREQHRPGRSNSALRLLTVAEGLWAASASDRTSDPIGATQVTNQDAHLSLVMLDGNRWCRRLRGLPHLTRGRLSIDGRVFILVDPAAIRDRAYQS